MNDRHDDARLDAAIDRAVRDIMRGEPRSDLRERVLAELAGEPARAAWWPRLALGSVAVAAAIVLLMLVADRPAERPAERPVDQTLASAARPATARGNTRETAKLPGPTPPVHVDEPAVRPATRRPVVEDRLVQAASIDPSEPIAIEPMAVERLAPIDPIRIAGLEAPAVSETSLKPITIERIEITPLTPPRR